MTSKRRFLVLLPLALAACGRGKPASGPADAATIPIPDAASPDANPPEATPPDLPPPDLAADLSHDLAPTPERDFVYVANQDDNTVTAFVVELATGKPTTPPGSPYAVGTRPFDLAVAAAAEGSFLLVADFGSDDLRSYRIEPTGALTAVPDPPVTIPMPYRLVVTPSGRFVYVRSAGDGELRAAAIDPRTGALRALGTVVSFPRLILGLAIDPTGRFLVMTTLDNPTGKGYLHVFSIDAGTGALTERGAPLAYPGMLDVNRPALGFSPRGDYLYGPGKLLGEGDKIFGFAASASGDITALTVGPWHGQYEGQVVIFHPTRPVLYWGGTENAGLYTVGSGGVLMELVQSPRAFNNASDMVISPSGRYLYVNHQFKNELRIVELDDADTLPEIPGSPWKTGANAYAVTVARPPPSVQR